LRKTYGRTNTGATITQKDSDDSDDERHGASLISEKVLPHTRSFANLSSINYQDRDQGLESNSNRNSVRTSTINYPQNLDNIKQAYYSKMQALTQKLEDEKNR
jgi:hypothetical protein